LSPIVAPGQTGYRGGGGTSQVTADELHALLWFVGGLSPFGTSGAQTLINSVNSVGAQFAAAAAHHAPVRLLEVVPRAGAAPPPPSRRPPSGGVSPPSPGHALGARAPGHRARFFPPTRRAPGGPELGPPAEIMAAAASAWRMPESPAPSPPCGA